MTIDSDLFQEKLLSCKDYSLEEKLKNRQRLSDIFFHRFFPAESYSQLQDVSLNDTLCVFSDLNGYMEGEFQDDKETQKLAERFLSSSVPAVRRVRVL